MKTFIQVLSEAVDYFSKNGYSKSQIDFWTRALKESLIRYLPTERQIKDKADKQLKAVYTRSVRKITKSVGSINPDTNRPYAALTKANIAGLERELELAVGKSLSLITNNRDMLIQHMVNKFQGWVTSVPVEPSKPTKKHPEGRGSRLPYAPGKDVKADIKKLALSEKYKVNRVLIDQSHKMVSNIDSVYAKKNGAIAAKWQISHSKEGVGGRPYEHRPEHVAREGKIFLIENSWAQEQGLVKPVNGYTTDIEQPAELPFCRCSYSYIYNVSALPEEFLTIKAKKMLQSK